MGILHSGVLSDFVDRWSGHGYEKGETQQFWLQLLREIGYPHTDDVLFEYHLPNNGFIDVWLRDARVLIEQKALGTDLDKPEERQNKMKTPLDQALDYCEDLPRLNQPRFVITCNFAVFRIYDRDQFGRSELAAHAFEFTLTELGKHPEYLGFILDPQNSRLEKEKEVSIQAGELIGQLYDQLRTGYLDPDSPETMHALNALCVRLVFCLYCEDADLFSKDAFYRYLSPIPPSQIRSALKTLFQALDTPLEQRDPYETSVKDFPYVNGGLFREDTQIPNFTAEMKQFLLEEVSRKINWSKISPTIFGGIFESTLNPQTRRAGGMHYTSVENIHKVIDPLFLDDLKAEFAQINAANLIPRTRKRKLAVFHEKLCSLTFFDPACGSGNFLTETYICLRRLEEDVLSTLREGQTQLGLDQEQHGGSRVSLAQFYGIEINDFAVNVAQAALWISRLKTNGESVMFYDNPQDFPLSERANIAHANALTIDWDTVLPAEQCTYVLGNPPFIGYSRLSTEQKQERLHIFGKTGGVLDYVACWYKKCADYMRGNKAIQAAFVSTNSICQGQQVAPLWEPLFAEGIVFNFAHRTFIWSSEASDQAHVYCVIIGFSFTERDTKWVWDAVSRSSTQDSSKPRGEDGTPASGSSAAGSGLGGTVSGEGLSHPASPRRVEHINGYLAAAPDVFLTRRAKPLCDTPPMNRGNQSTDAGNLLLSPSEREELLAAEPGAAKWIRKFSMGAEFINGKDRYCLWLADINPAELKDFPQVAARVERVREMRLQSSKAATRKKADTSWLFDEIRYTGTGTYIGVPAVSSERRKYIPIGFVTDGMIPGNKLYFIPTASLYVFGVLLSQVHNAWMRAVAGRLEMRYNYGNTTVYNNFIWPDPSPQQRAGIEECARAVLAAREYYQYPPARSTPPAEHSSTPNASKKTSATTTTSAPSWEAAAQRRPSASLADLYDPDNQWRYPKLAAAHRALDLAVEQAYGLDIRAELDDAAREQLIVAHLFTLYQQATA